MSKSANPVASSPSLSRAELVRSIVRGERRFHQVPKDLPPEEAAEVRRQALEQMTRTPLNNIAHHSLDVGRASHRNCENFIGVAQIPMGVVGPLRVRGKHLDEDVYIPLATTEAALVASTNRGCTALREAGGAVVRVEDVGMTRAPVFRTSGIIQTQQFIQWIQDHEEEVRRTAEGTSRYLKLLEVRPFAFGTTVFLRFRFDSGDAMGMNMVTIACDRVVTELIEPSTGVPCVGLSGNYCVDKKPAAVNFQEGRGKRIYAEVQLEAPVLHHILKTSARDLVEVQYRKNLLGSIAAGSMGFNAHYANVVAAFFIATGQDPAHVVEGSLGVTCIEPRGPDSVFASIFMPDVPLGAIGGGTALDTQREALAVLGVSPDPERRGEAVTRLAEILGAVVLAGELSLMAAFTSQDLARAHEKLGRGTLPPDPLLRP
jgi:hydroxymethylglutaryl-CoA reductase (NADPH)